MAGVATVRKVKTGRRDVRAALSLVFAVAWLLASPAVLPAGGQSEGDRQRLGEEIESYRSRVQEASAEEARLLTELDESAARKRELDAKVSALDQDIGVTQRNLNAAQQKLAVAEAEERGAEARLAEAQKELAAARAKLQAYAIAAYTGQSDAARVLEITLKAHSMGELVAKRGYMKAVATNQTEVIALDERLRDEVADLRDRLEVVRDEAEGQRNVVAEERSRLQASRDAQDEVRDQVAVEIARTDEVRAEVVARKAEFETQIEELEQESAAIEATLRQRAEEERARAAAAAAAPTVPTPGPGAEPGTAAATTAPAAPTASPGAGGLVNPLPGAPITSPFGYRVHPIYGDARLHTGVDMGASSGTPIRAAGNGVVVIAEWYGGYGNATIIDHGNGLATLYGHQSSFGVSAGQRVTQGQVIGRVGCTGSCTGPHLHFEVRVDGTPVNPMNYI
ncbi:MAG: peptidoglycan DD-metalloendopeptidase family protein [Actinomycetota bacterium]|nr:peptidoglycan DD-metalloendopeptidase family protein [Actinomycetota bacterium]